MKNNIIIFIIIFYILDIIDSSNPIKKSLKHHKYQQSYYNKKYRNLQHIQRNETEMSEYIINITELYFHDRNQIDFTIYYQPRIIAYIPLLLELEITKFIPSENYMTSKTIDINITLNNNSEKYTEILENLNITGHTEIKILGAIINLDGKQNNSQIFYPIARLVIRNETDEDVINQSSFYLENNLNYEGNFVNGRNKSFDKFSVAEIVGVVLSIFLTIIFIVSIICCFRKKKLLNNECNLNSDNADSSNIISERSEPNIIILEEPKKNKRTFIFETQNQDIIVITIESNKTMKDLIQLFFDKINRKDLMGDNSIYFLNEATIISFDSDQEPLENKFKDYRLLNKIIVVDREDKIKINKN